MKKARSKFMQLLRNYVAYSIRRERFLYRPENIDYLIYDIQERSKIKLDMKTIKKVEIEPVFVELIPENLEQNKIYISEKYEIAMHKCLCGCGETVAMPLDMWQLIKNNSKVSFTPSVGCFSFPCKSHYIITNNIANFV